jgi:hypothetical protein
VCCVAFWFTRRADSFRGFVGNLKDMNPGSINSDGIEEDITNKWFVVVGRNKRGLSR